MRPEQYASVTPSNRHDAIMRPVDYILSLTCPKNPNFVKFLRRSQISSPFAHPPYHPSDKMQSRRVAITVTI
jgi:hypothetical protein